MAVCDDPACRLKAKEREHLEKVAAGRRLMDQDEAEFGPARPGDGARRAIHAFGEALERLAEED